MAKGGSGDVLTGIITALLAQHPHLHLLPPPTASAAKDEFDYLTNFERKFRSVTHGMPTDPA